MVVGVTCGVHLGYIHSTMAKYKLSHCMAVFPLHNRVYCIIITTTNASRMYLSYNSGVIPTYGEDKMKVTCRQHCYWRYCTFCFILMCLLLLHASYNYHFFPVVYIVPIWLFYVFLVMFPFSINYTIMMTSLPCDRY